MQYEIKMPSYLYGGEGCIEKVKDILKKENTKKVIVFTDKGVRQTGLSDILENILKECSVDYKVFDDLKPEPAYTDVEKVINEVESYEGDIIIAIGGGSVMDSAKLCSILKGASYSIRDLLNGTTDVKKQIKSIMIPTTCGTGSEATCNAIVAIPEEQSKKGIVNDCMIPDYVILDAQMIKNLPKSIVSATGVDALAHAVECYTSKKATPFSDVYAMESAKLIFKNIREAYKNPDNMEAKTNMMLGAFYGGVSITGSGTTAVHALSYPLGGKYHIAHGVSNAILFAHVMEFNKDACKERLAKMCDVIFPELIEKTVSEKADYIIEQISDIVTVTDIPTDLSKWGVSIDDLDFLVDAGSKQQRLLVNNMKELSLEDIKNIYMKVLK
ncbi:MAG: iron-containing alcohol dehydrogenase [Tyzzerella sp.]|uniref:Iron-containing alcohol dehydrogenase n=1 Tax=Candidatus Fimicola merdigallinarum TaxID=2840819 RepID=A0A9D9DW36_9FIRM|nr:iron-containing alcohol dehydrogenase [Candidatus Fimicola merdigallinarum]